MLLGISDMVNARAFKPLPLCSASPWNLTSRDFWSSRNEGKPLSQQKCVLRKCCWVSLKQMDARAFKPLPLWFSSPENLQVKISGALGMKESHYLSKNVFWENAVGYLRYGECLELSNLCHCVQHRWKLTSKDFWSSRNEGKATFNQQKCVLR